MSDDFLDRMIDRLQEQLEPKRKTNINIIKKKKVAPIIKDISNKLDAISEIPESEENKSKEPEIKKPKKVIWL